MKIEKWDPEQKILTINEENKAGRFQDFRLSNFTARGKIHIEVLKHFGDHNHDSGTTITEEQIGKCSDELFAMCRAIEYFYFDDDVLP